jgi:hypothetical protein
MFHRRQLTAGADQIQTQLLPVGRQHVLGLRLRSFEQREHRLLGRLLHRIHRRLHCGHCVAPTGIVLRAVAHLLARIAANADLLPTG